MSGIDVSKTCKPKNLRRLILALLLIAPLVYLFGTQFFALAGAHGEEVLAVEQKEMNTDVVIDDVSYRRLWQYSTWSLRDFHLDIDEFYLGSVFNAFGGDIAVTGFQSFFSSTGVDLGDVDYSFYFGDDGYLYDFIYPSFGCFADFFVVDLNNEEWYYTAFYSTGSDYYYATVNFDDSPISLSFSSYSGGLFINEGASICFDLDMVDFSIASFTRSEFLSILPYEYPIPKVDENYSDTLQNHFFNQNNWVSSIGRDVYAAEEVGFTPFGSMIRFVDENALHLEGTEWGDFLAGYAYYCANVVFFYEICALAILIITIPMRLLDSFQKGE